MGGGASSSSRAPKASSRYEDQKQLGDPETADVRGLELAESLAYRVPKAVDAVARPKVEEVAVSPQAVRVRAATTTPSPTRSDGSVPSPHSAQKLLPKANHDTNTARSLTDASAPALASDGQVWGKPKQRPAPAAKQINSTPVTAERAASQQAAMSAVQAVVHSPMQTPTQRGVLPRALVPRGAAQTQGKDRFAPGPDSPGRQRFKRFEVPVTAKKLMVHWVRMSRKRVEEMTRRRQMEWQQTPTAVSKAAGQEGAVVKRRKVAARVDRLVGMYLDNQEELEKMCLKDPTHLLTAQIDLLTRRINTLTEAAAQTNNSSLASPESLDKKPAARPLPEGTLPQLDRPTRKRKPDNPEPKRASAQGKPERRERAVGVVLSWEEAFDRAMKTREDWKKNRDKAMSANRRPLKAEPVASARRKDKGVDMTIVAHLRAEREKLAEVILAFEARVRKNEDQAAIDLADSMAEARRQAYARRDAEIRERHRKEEEERRRLEERKRRLEEEERARQEELRRLEMEEKRKREEEEAWRQKLREQEQISWKKREEERKRREEEMAIMAAARKAAEEAARAAVEERRREEQAIAAAKERARIADAFVELETACEEAEVAEALTAAQDAEERPPAESSSERDWMARALEALEGGDDEDSEDDESDEWAGAAVVTGAADLELAHLSEAIARKINQLHRLEPQGSRDSISGSPL